MSASAGFLWILPQLRVGEANDDRLSAEGLVLCSRQVAGDAGDSRALLKHQPAAGDRIARRQDSSHFLRQTNAFGQ